MPETVIYRGPSGTTIDWLALEAELEANDYLLSLCRDAELVIGHGPVARTLGTFTDSHCAEVTKLHPDGRLIAVDEEVYEVEERVEGLANLLRRVLPEPAKVIAHMSDEQWTTRSHTA